MSVFSLIGKPEEIWNIVSGPKSMKYLLSSFENQSVVVFSFSEEFPKKDIRIFQARVIIDGISISGVRTEKGQRKFNGVCSLEGILVCDQNPVFFVGTFNIDTGKGKVELNCVVDPKMKQRT